MLKVIGHRLPPGDRWTLETVDGAVYNSLTEALNEVYKQFQCTEFIMNAAKGTIEIDDGKEAPPEPPKTWDLYGEK